jgi:glucose-1-phosphate thymidylyltransferase
MKGIILAGGSGSRLYPLTKAVNKHLLPVGRYPMLFHPLYKLWETGIRDILIVSNREHMGSLTALLGSGAGLGLNLTYKIQEHAGGIAQALGLAEDFAGGDRCIVVLGDNIFEDNLAAYIEAYYKQEKGARILLKAVKDPRPFGVAAFDGDRLVSIVEKPQIPPSQYIVTGIYMYDSSVFDIIKTLRPSARGELEITDVNNSYLKNQALSYDILKGWWTDAGTFDTLALANELTADIQLFSSSSLGGAGM